MLPTDLLRRVVEALDRLGVPYFLTGSAASSIYGEPRFTQDVDLVVSLPIHKVNALCAEFPPDEFYVSEEAATEAVRHAGQFNIIHTASAFKADLIVADDSGFTEGRFVRSRILKPGLVEFEVRVSSPEDVILKKLESHREGGSDKHLRDVAGIVRRMGDELDQIFLDGWASRLGVRDQWHEVLRRVTKPSSSPPA